MSGRHTHVHQNFWCFDRITETMGMIRQRSGTVWPRPVQSCLTQPRCASTTFAPSPFFPSSRPTSLPHSPNLKRTGGRAITGPRRPPSFFSGNCESKSSSPHTGGQHTQQGSSHPRGEIQWEIQLAPVPGSFPRESSISLHVGPRSRGGIQ